MFTTTSKVGPFIVGTTALIVSLATLWTSPLSAQQLQCDLAGFSGSVGMEASRTSTGVELVWNGTGSEEIQLRLTSINGTPVIERLAVREAGNPWLPVAENARIEYNIVEGLRRISNQQLRPLRDLGVELTQEIVDRHKWDAFHDAPLDMRTEGLGGGNPPPVDGIPGTDQPPLPRSPDEVRRADVAYDVSTCDVVSEGLRTVVTLPGVTLGSFSGELTLTVFRGTNLIETAVRAATSLPSVAYKYDVGLTGLPYGPNSLVYYRDIANFPKPFGMRGPANDKPVVVPAANRLIVAEIDGASIGAFPPPHTFFWARQINANVGYNWFRKDSEESFSIGIRQGESEVADNWLANWALYSAPPGTVQQMKAYFYPAVGTYQNAADAVLAFTNGDVYRKPDGYETMGSHYHINVGQRIDAAGGDLDIHIPDFDVLRSAGLTIVGPAERPQNQRQVELMSWVFEYAERHSDENFMIYPQMERGNLLGGHWDLLFSHPVLYTALDDRRTAGQPLVVVDETYGPVYQIGSIEDFLEMFEAEDMLVYMPHPRTKGSTGYPDAIADSPQFLHDSYRGAGWRWGMGSDLSELRLSEKRVIELLDDMNNWIADTDLKLKALNAITETYYTNYGYDVYGGGPVTYVRLEDGLPEPGNYRPIAVALAAGDYFLSSGEVVIPEHGFTGSGSSMTLTADVAWTFPLEFVEIVSGDGQTTTSKVVRAADLPAHGSHTFTIPFDGTGQEWVRFAAWDIAGNGAMTNAVRINR